VKPLVFYEVDVLNVNNPVPADYSVYRFNKMFAPLELHTSISIANLYMSRWMSILSPFRTGFPRKDHAAKCTYKWIITQAKYTCVHF